MERNIQLRPTELDKDIKPSHALDHPRLLGKITLGKNLVLPIVDSLVLEERESRATFAVERGSIEPFDKGPDHTLIDAVRDNTLILEYLLNPYAIRRLREEWVQYRRCILPVKIEQNENFQHLQTEGEVTDWLALPSPIESSNENARQIQKCFNNMLRLQASIDMTNTLRNNAYRRRGSSEEEKYLQIELEGKLIQAMGDLENMLRGNTEAVHFVSKLLKSGDELQVVWGLSLLPDNHLQQFQAALRKVATDLRMSLSTRSAARDRMSRLSRHKVAMRPW